MFSLLSVDPFETMLKSLLRYQSSLNGDTGVSHMRRKLYENGVTKSLQSNIALIQKVSAFVQQRSPVWLTGEGLVRMITRIKDLHSN